MADFILRFQAADFSNTVFDMPKLSAIRGASLAYLYSPKLVGKILRDVTGPETEEIYTGASQGAWRLDCDKATALRAMEAVRQALTKDHSETGPHSHLSYTVSLAEGSDAKALAVAEGLNETARYQGTGYPLPVFDMSVSGYDEGGDRTRPAHKDKPSSARKAREEFGRDQWQKFYEAILHKNPSHGFTEDFDKMVASPPAFEAVSPGSKTAVFYADGNKLGAARDAALAQGMEKLNDFSKTLRTLQVRLLGKIVDWLEKGATDKDRPKHFISEDRFRFETLLWGGDEVLFVMPSWLALEFANNFFEWTQGWDVGGEKDVTFSAGLVIANHKTPIRQTTKLAKELAELNKLGGGNSSAIQIEIFESISVPDTDLGTYRKRLYPGTHDGDRDALDKALAIPGVNLDAVLTKIGELKHDENVKKRLPKSQLYNMLRKDASTCRSDRDDIDGSAKIAFEEWKRRAGSGTKLEWSDIIILGDKVSPNLSLAMLAMLWDYVMEPDAKAAGSAS